MKLELDDNSAWTSVLITLIVAISLLGAHGCTQTENTKRIAFQSGLEEVQQAGSHNTMYAKHPSK